MSVQSTHSPTYSKWGLVAPSIMAIVVASTPVAMALVAGRGVSLSCRRDAGDEGACTIVDRRMFRNDVFVVDASNIEAVDVSYTVSQDVVLGEQYCYFPEIVLNEGSSRRTVPFKATCSEQKARDATHQLSRFINSADNEFSVKFESGHNVLLAGLPFFGFSLLVFLLIIRPGWKLLSDRHQ